MCSLVHWAPVSLYCGNYRCWCRCCFQSGECMSVYFEASDYDICLSDEPLRENSSETRETKKAIVWKSRSQFASWNCIHLRAGCPFYRMVSFEWRCMIPFANKVKVGSCGVRISVTQHRYPDGEVYHKVFLRFVPISGRVHPYLA